MDGDGLTIPDGALLSNREIALEPGQSRLVMFTAPSKGSEIVAGAPYGTYTLYTTDGGRQSVEVDRSDLLTGPVADHYLGLNGFDTARIECATKAGGASK